MQDQDRKVLLEKLSKPKLEQGDLKDDRPRLYFDLKNAELIPDLHGRDPTPAEGLQRPAADLGGSGAGPARPPCRSAWPIAVVLSIGFLAGFFFRSDRPGAGPGILLQVLFGLVSLGGFLIGRHGGLGGWIFWIAALADPVRAVLHSVPGAVGLVRLRGGGRPAGHGVADPETAAVGVR